MIRRISPHLLAAMAIVMAGCAAQPQQAATTQIVVSNADKPSSQPAASQPAHDRQPLRVSSYVAAGDGALVVRLENGLTVIIKPSRTAPVVDVRAMVRAGSLYEGKFLGCGVSHLLEHLVANEAEHDGQARSGGQIQQIGGQSNASTSLDHTTYYVSASAGKVMDCIDMVADWMARPRIAKADFEREHGVVQRELEMGKDEPSRQLSYAEMSNVFGVHPAGVPVIGLPAPLANLTYEDVLEYHRRMYVPQNMVFCVVGDVDAQAVLEKVRLAFAGFSAGASPNLATPPVEPLTGVRRQVVPNAAVKEVMEEIDFITVPLSHEDLYALDVLSYVLGEGKASRLVQKIQRQAKLVTSVSSSSWTPAWGDGVFNVAFRASPDKADSAEAAILDELKSIVADGVSDDELARAKRQKTADYVYSQQTFESQAATLAVDYLSTGDAGFSKDYAARIQAVTADQVKQAAKRYFKFDAVAFTRMAPQSLVSASRPATQAADEGKAEVFTLPNGLRVVLRPTGPCGLASMVFAVKGGLLSQTPRTDGMGMLMAQLSTKGAGPLNADQIAEFFDQAGGALKAECGNNSIYWQATVLNDSFDKALAILADVIRRPTFSPKELDILRPVLLAAIDRQDENWQSQLMKFFRSKFFASSPYRMLPSGAKEVVGSASAEQVADFHRQVVRAESSVLTVYGQFDAASTRDRLVELFSAVPPGAAELDLPTVKPSAAGNIAVLPTENTTAGVIVAVPGMTFADVKDRAAMDVLDTIISGYHMPSGWLHEDLRGKQLVYVVHAINWAGLVPGSFLTYAGCQPTNVGRVLDVIENDLRKASDYSPSPRELQEAVDTILTAELLGNQSIPALALAAALDELYGLGYDFHTKLEGYYRAVTADDVRRVGQKYLSGPYEIFVTTPRPDLVKRQPASRPAEQ